MVNSCSVCTNPKAAEIDEAIIRGDANRRTASLHGLTEAAIRRHKKHLPATLARAKDAVEVARADALLDQVTTGQGRAEKLYGFAEKILEGALAENSPRTALAAIKAAVDVMGEARQYLELRGELCGELGKNRGDSGEKRPNVTIIFPTISAEQLEAVNNAPTIDLPPMARRLLNRPSDGQQR